jgi:hypothetical protein
LRGLCHPFGDYDSNLTSSCKDSVIYILTCFHVMNLKEDDLQLQIYCSRSLQNITTQQMQNCRPSKTFPEAAETFSFTLNRSEISNEFFAIHMKNPVAEH